jgi:putative heme-binding domain-containing protein
MTEVPVPARAAISASVVLLLLTVHASAQSQTPRARRAVPATQTIAAGKTLFDAQCAWCHGAGGDGGTGPNLHGRLRHATDDKSIVEIITSGIPGTEMPSFRSPLTARNIGQIAAYVQSLGRTKGPAVAGNADHGSAIYQASGCASCHVIAGAGGILGPELTSIGATRGGPYLREAVVKPAAAHPPGYLVVRAVRNDGQEVRGIRVNEDVFWIQLRDAGGNIHVLQKADLSKVERQLDASLMPSYATRIKDAELDDLVAYLSALRGAK